MWYVAKASEYLVITGLFVKDIKLAKKAWVLVGQKCNIIDITPVNYTFNVQAMSAEKLPFTLPAVFTIGPKTDDNEALYKYARLVAPHDKHSHQMNDTVKGIIEGETRVLAAGMTMEEIFKGAKEFKSEVFKKVQLELDQFGLHIYNANVKQLEDVEGHEYFSFLGQKTQKEAENQAKVDVAEATYKGNKGAKEREGLITRQTARIDAETAIYKAQQTGEAQKRNADVEAEAKVFVNEKAAAVAKADAELAVKKAGWMQETKIAEVEARKKAEIRESDMQQELERKKAQAKTEKLRATKLAHAMIGYEASQQDAKAELYKRERAAEAELYKIRRAAEAQLETAKAAAAAERQRADALLFSKQKEADGLRATASAHAYYARVMVVALGEAILVILFLVRVSSWLGSLTLPFFKNPATTLLDPPPQMLG